MPAPTQESLGNAPAAYRPEFATTQNPVSQQLAVNPQLVTHPLGQFTDTLYESQEIELRATTLRNYNDLLQQLGYLDPETGQFIRGSIETEAQAEEMRQAYGMEIARQGVTDAMQRSSTMFSGYRGTQQARAENPYLEAIGALRTSVPTQLSAAYTNALRTLEDYRIDQMGLLLDAAGRKTTDLENNPPAEEEETPAASAGASGAGAEQITVGIQDPYGNWHPTKVTPKPIATPPSAPSSVSKPTAIQDPYGNWHTL